MPILPNPRRIGTLFLFYLTLPIRHDTCGHFFSVVRIVPNIPANNLPAGKELGGIWVAEILGADGIGIPPTKPSSTKFQTHAIAQLGRADSPARA
jgi:hypothetical protein